MIKNMFYWLLCLATLVCSVATLAQSSPVKDEYMKFKLHDSGEVNFSNGQRYAYSVTGRVVKNDIEVITARIHDPLQADLAHYNNLVVTLDNKTQELQGVAETSDGHFTIDVHNRDGQIWKKVKVPQQMDSLIPMATPRLTTMQKMSATPSVAAAAADGEKDANGNYVIDVFMGFSDRAATKVGNIETYAQMQVETVNTALRNSNIQGVYLRLVGVGQVPYNPGVIWDPLLADLKVWFKDDIERLQPDLIGMQQVNTGVAGEAAGWAGVGGTSDTQVVGVDYPYAWRHEVGHNVGGNHCKEPGDTGYNYGYKVRQGRATAMCGNDLAYYSSPLIRDEEGNVLGTAEGQDMARVWRERMAEMASRRIHTVPYESDNGLPIRLQAEDYLAFHDSTVGNQGGAYRQDNVDIQATTDSGGGFNVGWISAGEWLTYNIRIPSDGEYEVSYRVASLNKVGSIQLEKAGGSVVYGTVSVPVTGGWQNWVTVKQKVTLKSGTQSIALVFKSSDFNINWFKIDKASLANNNVVIQNRWYPSQSLNIEQGYLASSSVSASLLSNQWIMEPVTGSTYFRIKNRLKPTEYIHIEYGKLDVGSISPGWWSAQWTITPVEGFTDLYRIQNRWQPDNYINIEGNQLHVSSIQSGWWSAMWKFMPVN